MINVKQVYSIEDKVISDIVMGLTEGEYDITEFGRDQEVLTIDRVREHHRAVLVLKSGYTITIEREAIR